VKSALTILALASALLWIEQGRQRSETRALRDYVEHVRSRSDSLATARLLLDLEAVRRERDALLKPRP
jgi:hypothetical protein